MDVFRVSSNDFRPRDLIEGYSSMIWTERYAGAGEFEMVTSEVKGTLDYLPEGSMITIRGSTDIMMVETRSVSVNDKGYPELKVTGRSLDTFLEKRALIASTYNTPWKALQNYKNSDMALLIIWNEIVNNTGQDPTRVGGTQDTARAIPNVVVTDSATLAETPQEWWLESGEVYAFVKDIISIYGYGIRCMRPFPESVGGTVVTVDTSATASRGTLIKTYTANISQLRFDVFNGVDRSHTQSTYDPVVFHYETGDIDEPSYLRSIRDWRNVAVVTSSLGKTEVPGDPPPSSGLNRRVLYLDGGDIGTTDTATFQAAITQKAKSELKKSNAQYMFDGAISPVSRYKFGEHYGLGDWVTFISGFGVKQRMMVSEFIRTEDEDGDRGYPGLSTGATAETFL